MLGFTLGLVSTRSGGSTAPLYDEDLVTQIFDSVSPSVVEISVRRIWIQFSSHWPRRSLFVRIGEAVDRYLAGFLPEPTANGPPRDLLWLG